ncbi:RrF2 family transcriptional regulator [Kocuria nitroreducens]|uniref:RrF2 family transcriptional regulator n=1 Tax=Kocuria nitroreducens TaxID=3058914 RepID=UPI0036D8F79F
MRLTAFSDIALRVLLLTGAVADGQQMTTRAIAEGVGAPYHHVTKTVSRLVGLGLLTSTRGRSGGVSITPAGLDASVGQILRELEAGSAMVECESPGGRCPLDNECRLRLALTQARDAFYRELDGVHVKDLISQRQVGPVMVALSMRAPEFPGGRDAVTPTPGNTTTRDPVAQ